MSVSNTVIQQAGVQSSGARRRAILACAIGNFFELFDFTIYGYFAVAIGRAFYPSGSMLGTYAGFAAAFLMRPIGALLLGAFGDRHGRRGALIVTVGLMAGATGFTGLIPGYHAIGLFAPVLLIIFRLIQGFSTGGEWGGAAAFLVEYAPAGRRGFIGSWQQFTAQLGSMSGLIAAVLLAANLPTQQFYDWGWRVPFLLGFILGPVGYYLRTRIAETPSFEMTERNHHLAHSPVRTAFRFHRVAMLQAFGASAVGCIANYTFVIYLVGYCIGTLKMPVAATLSCAILSSLTMLVGIPLVGWLSDRIGRRPPMLASALLHLGIDYPLFMVVVHGHTPQWLALALFCHALVQCLSGGTLAALLAEMFPTPVRYTALSLSYGSAVVLFGGFAPFISTWLVGRTGNPMAPAFYIMLGAVVTATAILSMKETLNRPLD